MHANASPDRFPPRSGFLSQSPLGVWTASLVARVRDHGLHLSVEVCGAVGGEVCE
jgi:hypothetical protein